MKRSIIMLVLAVLALAVMFVLGNRKADAPATETPSAAQQAELEKRLAGVPLLPPVAPTDFGDLNLVKALPETLVIQQPSRATKLGNQLDPNTYQGVIYKESDTFFRVLFGKLSDKSEGKLELRDGFELVAAPRGDGTTDVSLRETDPKTLELDTTKVVRWANLPNSNQIIRALLQYKEAQ